MTSTFTPNVNLNEPALGDYVNTWSTPMNSNFTIIDNKFGSYTTFTVTGGTISPTVTQVAYATLAFLGTLTSSQTVILPVAGFWFLENTCSGSFTLTVKGSSGDTGYVIPASSTMLLYSNGTVMYTPYNSAIIKAALGYTPANVAGDTFTGPMVFSSSATFNATANFTGGTITVNTVSTSDNSTKAASTALVTNKIAAQIANTPQVTVYTTGSGTYPTPSAAMYIEVECLGGGGGGGGSGTSGAGVGTAGGATTFGSLSAGGAPATPGSSATTYPTPAAATGGDLNIPGALGGGQGQLNTGAAGTGFTPSGASSIYGGGGPGTSGQGNVAAADATGYGAGGGAGGYSVNTPYNNGWAGNAGAYLRKLIAAPASTYSYAVGGAGTGGIAGASGAAGGNGSGGLIRVTAYFQ